MISLHRVAIGAVVAGALAAPALAVPISSPFNTRPVTVNDSGEPTLQEALDGLWGATAPNAATDQQAAGMWGFSSNVPSTAPTMVVEHAGLAPTNKFGIWFGNDTDTTQLFHWDVLLGNAEGGILFDAASLVVYGNTLVVKSAGFSDCADQVNCTPAGGVTNSLINPFAFGFYLDNGSERFYTLDELNGDGQAHALAFREAGTTDWAFAFEDLTKGHPSDFDYNDMVVKVESLEPVPEPGTLLLLGSGIVGLAARRRRNRS